MFENLFAERGLSLDRMRVLVEVHDAGSIAQAVPDDPVRQSQYSRQLRELAEFFGCEVARRQGKVLQLTDAGARLAELARTQLQSLEDFRAGCRAEQVDYTIAAGDSMIQWLIIPRLGDVGAQFPSVRFATANLRTREIVQQLHDGRIDFGVLRRDAVPKDLKVKALGPWSFVLVVPKALHRKRTAPTLTEALASLPFVAQKSDGQFMRRLQEIACSAGVDFSPALYSESFPQSLCAVNTGHYAAILPTMAAAHLAGPGYFQVETEELAGLSRELVLAWPDRTAIVRPQTARLVRQLGTTFQLE